MKVLHEVVRYWTQIEDENISQTGIECCHGAHAFRYLKSMQENEEMGETDYRKFPAELLKRLGYGNEAQVILMLRQAGAPEKPLGFYGWHNRKGIYANLLKVERLPSLVGANLRYADLREMDLRGADMTDVDLTRADLKGANLAGAKMVRANLTGAMLQKANLSGVDLSDAILRGAKLRFANLEGARVRNTECFGTDFTVANLKRADFTRSTWKDVITLYADTTGTQLP